MTTINSRIEALQLRALHQARGRTGFLRMALIADYGVWKR